MSQEPKIIDVDEMKFVGMGLEHNVHESAAGNGDPGALLWGRFEPRSNEIKNGTDCYVGVCGPVLKGGLSSYTAALQVSKISEVPTGMVSGTVPAGRYAKFIHHGPIAKIWETVDFIHNQWMPKAGYKGHDCRQVEVYTWGTDVDAPDFKLEILVPLN